MKFETPFTQAQKKLVISVFDELQSEFDALKNSEREHLRMDILNDNLENLNNNYKEIFQRSSLILRMLKEIITWSPEIKEDFEELLEEKKYSLLKSLFDGKNIKKNKHNNTIL